ncbi:hypothetical protein SLG_12070 [Sphingobium sp. SYK-6]|uniref:hypothetical protein n=1 Tax=Sphingobium sp. (strain NBRC 103272 / SYK-6) TaxID=627192 RepID=UPI00022771FA|nr:hypothetical protein [Sphingobium sp. SYK-6]BAK65882.1 hypothetical protein SLG_12070 [Sphingobium sp. SYK-6]
MNIKAIILPLASLGMAAAATATVRTSVVLDEERMARQEERHVIATPIAGIENRFWFNYRTDINEARKELTSDLRRASDTEDLRDAWDEYRHELSHNRGRYVKEMAKRGYRYGTVTVGS